jgi:hypothetical protein
MSQDVFHFKATGRHFMQDSLAINWGVPLRYVEVGDDQHTVRQVDVFKNGNSLRYDRTHWCDDYGMLLGLRFSYKPKWRKSFPDAVLITQTEFDKIWAAAENSPVRNLQLSSSRVAEWGNCRFP